MTAFPRVNQSPQLSRQKQRQQKRHKDRVNSVKAAVNNKPPKRFSHLENRKKRDAQMEERYQRIERENKLLLEKMSEIMREGGAIDNDGSRLTSTAASRGLITPAGWSRSDSRTTRPASSRSFRVAWSAPERSAPTGPSTRSASARRSPQAVGWSAQHHSIQANDAAVVSNPAPTRVFT